jgi:hypothetical protein
VREWISVSGVFEWASEPSKCVSAQSIAINSTQLFPQIISKNVDRHLKLIGAIKCFYLN